MSTKPNVPPGGRSCVTCPSFLADSKQRQTMGSDISSPICAIKMLPLIKPTQPRETQNRALSHMAKDCSDFGREVEINSMPPEYAPSLHVGLCADSMNTAPDNQQNARCGDCVHFVRSLEVSEETGWAASLCKASGSLMLDTKLPLYASKCGTYKRRVGPKPTTGNLNNFTFMPYLSNSFGKIDLAAVYLKNISGQSNPIDYPTDREVTEAHAKRGIRAWQRISDPEGYGADTYLPIYDPASFSPELRALVPKIDRDNRPDMYADHTGYLYSLIVLWRELDETPAFWGQGGVGKTEFANHIAWRMQLPFNRISLTASSELDDIIGKLLFRNNETVFQYGRLPKAWKSPGVILLDEPNTAPNDIWQRIRPLTDNSRVLELDENIAEKITRGPDTYLTLAMNPQWDPRNVGTNTIGDADSSRLMHMYFGLPPREIEVAIIQARVGLDGWELDPRQVKAMMGVANDLREASEGGSLHSSWGIRHQIKVARALKWWPPVVAYRRAVGDALEPSQLEFVLGAVNAHFVTR